MFIRSRIGRGLLTAALGVAAWSTLVEPRLFTLRRHTLPVLPEGSAPLRVLQLSDLHLAPWQHRKIEWVRGLVELRPDLVVLTGDLMGHRLARGPLLHTLSAVAEAEIPTVFVHGSNDYYSPIAKNPFVTKTESLRGFVFDVATGKLNDELHQETRNAERERDTRIQEAEEAKANLFKMIDVGHGDGGGVSQREGEACKSSRQLDKRIVEAQYH